MDASSPISQLDDLLQRIEPGMQEIHSEYSGGSYHVFKGPEYEGQLKPMPRAIAAVERLAPRESRYIADANQEHLRRNGPSSSLPTLAGILRALRDDYEAGYC